MHEEKQAFRRMLRKREELPHPGADALIIQRFLQLPAYRDAACVLAYISIGHEVDTAVLIREILKSGKRLCVPRCHAGGMMDAVEIFNTADLVDGMYHIPEPNQTLLPIDAQVVDLIVVPGMAFDRGRNRLGRGAGYYDRFLERAANAVTVGICRNSRLFDSVPCEAHDRKVDVLLTETELIEK